VTYAPPPVRQPIEIDVQVQGGGGRGRPAARRVVRPIVIQAPRFNNVRRYNGGGFGY